MRQLRLWLLALFLLLACGGGCARSTKTVKTETTYSSPSAPSVVERQTTVTAEESPEASGGVLSGTVNVIGEAIALPFRAVGGLVRAIF